MSNMSGVEDAGAGTAQARASADDVQDAGEDHARAAAFVADEPERRTEEELLSALGVDTEDPELDAEIRKLEAGATDDLPFGTPGPPTSARSPFFTAVVVTLGVLLVLSLAWAA